jgi:hypothetical protein
MMQKLGKGGKSAEKTATDAPGGWLLSLCEEKAKSELRV